MHCERLELITGFRLRFGDESFVVFVAEDGVGCLFDKSLELVDVEFVVAELFVSVLVTSVDGFDEVGVFPGLVVDATEASEVLVAVGILAVVDLEKSRPLGEEHEMSKTSSVDADEDVRVSRDLKLIFEREIVTKVDSLDGEFLV